MTTHDLDIYYSAYLKQRAKTLKYIKSRKGIIPTFGEKPISKRDFKMDIESIKSDNPKESYVAIAKRYAKNQLYEYSFKEAERRAEAHITRYGGKVDVNLIQRYRMQSERQIFDDILNTRTSLKAKGMTHDFEIGGKTYANIEVYISQEFFGSE